MIACGGALRAFRSIYASVRPLVVCAGDKVKINYEVEVR